LKGVAAMKDSKILVIGMLCILFVSSGVTLGSMSAEEILKKVDYNESPNTVVCDVKMTVYRSERTDVFTMKLYGSGTEKSYIYFLSPPRQKDVTSLRLDDNIWMYYPAAEKTIKLSGNMMRQSFMGSDFSLEDSTERTKFLEKYDATLAGTEKYNNLSAYLIELKAKRPNASYYRRKIWVDTERYITLKQEMYAKSGRLLKVQTIEEVEKIKDRYFEKRVRMVNKLQKETYTEKIFTNIVLDQPLSENIFTLQNLEKKN
jgi:outer membrane lipoprotein-sorting protein